MVEIPFLFLEVVFASIWLVIRIGVWSKQKYIDWKREAVLLLMYINLAVIIRFVFFPMSKVDGKVQPLISFIKVILVGGDISLCIEIIQLPFSVRASDIDDLILNTVGVLLGYGIYKLIQCLKRTKRELLV